MGFQILILMNTQGNDTFTNLLCTILIFTFYRFEHIAFEVAVKTACECIVNDLRETVEKLKIYERQISDIDLVEPVQNTPSPRSIYDASSKQGSDTLAFRASSNLSSSKLSQYNKSSYRKTEDVQLQSVESKPRR